MGENNINKETLARDIAAKYDLCYNDDNTIEAERTQLMQIKLALDELRQYVLMLDFRKLINCFIY